MTLADCYITMILILAPFGTDSRFDQMQLAGSACASSQVSSRITRQAELILTTKWFRYVIPLPRRIDHTRLSYQMQGEYAYLGDCAYGMKPYYYHDSSCQQVMVRFGPVGTY